MSCFIELNFSQTIISTLSSLLTSKYLPNQQVRKNQKRETPNLSISLLDRTVNREQSQQDINTGRGKHRAGETRLAEA
jgi:hypothetical protein